MSDFWNRALGTTAPAKARDEAPLDAWWAPPRPAPQPEQPQAPAPYATPQARPPQAKSALVNDRCPECGSASYFKPTPETRATCYTCGYPIRHTTSNMVTDRSVTSTPARQVKTGGFQPTRIIGRVN
jgi:ribosomal protein S27E